MLHIETSKIKAAMECVAMGKAEPRYYLKGVLLEITACGDVHLVSTDGEKMFAGRIPASAVQWHDVGGQTASYESMKNGAKQIILPYDALKSATKQKRLSTYISHMGEDVYEINGITCQAINGHFPNWRMVAEPALMGRNEEPAPMDWGRVAVVESALRAWSGCKTDTVRIKTRGDNGALLTCSDHNVFALVMPQKRKEQTPQITPNFPAPLKESAEV
jgi:hypothetical protein